MLEASGLGGRQGSGWTGTSQGRSFSSRTEKAALQPGDDIKIQSICVFSWQTERTSLSSSCREAGNPIVIHHLSSMTSSSEGRAEARADRTDPKRAIFGERERERGRCD